MRLWNTIKKNPYINVFTFDLISKVFTGIITIVLIRGLTISEYSEYTIFYTIASYIFGVVGGGLSIAFTRYYVEYRLRYGTMAKGIYKILIIFFSILLVFAALLTVISQKPSSSIYFLALIYGLSLCIDRINVSYFQAREFYSEAGIVNNLKSLIILLVIGLIYSVFNEIPVRLLFMSYIFTNMSINIFVCIRILSMEKSGTVLQGLCHIRGIFKDSVYILIYITLLNAFNYLDVFFIKIFCSDLAVAEYGIAYKYYALLLTLLPAIQVVKNIDTSRPEIIDNACERKKMVIRWIKKITPLAFVLILLGIPTTYIVFPIINGSQYDGAINAFIILMLGAMISYITSPNVNVMLATKKGAVICMFALCAFIVNVVGNYIFIPRYGINAAATTTVISNFIFNGFCTVYILRSN